jgi:hypothetical protein
MASALDVHRRLLVEFPGLTGSRYEITSQPTNKYNCIAWAAGDDEFWWWPGLHWPRDVPAKVTRLAFIKAFAERGYEQCAGPEAEEGFEKVCLYEKLGRPTHAARQLRNGAWTSKLGTAHDISHELEALSGKRYGHPTVYLKRRIFEGGE